MARDLVHLYFEAKDLPADEVRVFRVLASEHMSQPYRVEIDLAVREAHEVSAEQLAGIEGAVLLEHRGETRRIHGVVVEVSELPPVPGWRTFRLVLRPHVWLATLVQHHDIHLDQSVPDIVEARLTEVSSPPAMRLASSYPDREIVTQYAESDLAFVSRLCEHLGIFYFFEQGGEGEGERVVFGDDTHAYGHVAEDDTVPFAARGDAVSVFEIAETRRVVPSLFVCRDYNFRTPQVELAGQHRLEQGFAGGVIEYGGHFRTEEQGKQLAKVRAEEQLGRHASFAGKSSDIRFAPGHTFTLKDHPTHARRFVLVEVEHEARQPIFDGGGEEGRDYENRFVAIPADVAYRPPRITPVPRAHGLVTGIVETVQGQIESFAKIDDQGRYSVYFLFDTARPDRPRASAPVRMVQPSAGPGYGMHFPLKPGVEVVIAFIDGNVDRPIIVGAVPNPITPTPVAVDAHTKSRIVTRAGMIIEFDDANRRA